MHSHKAGTLRNLKEQRNRTKKLCQQMRYQGLKSVAWVLHTNGDLPGYLKNQTEPWLAGSPCARMEGAQNYADERSRYENRTNF